MAKVSDVRSGIVTRLKAIHPRVFYQVANDQAVFPYLVFNLPHSVDDGSMENFILEVDGWDAPANGDTTQLESIMDSVDKCLHRQTVIVADIVSITLYRENRMTLTDDEKTIRRRKYVYQARTHTGG